MWEFAPLQHRVAEFADHVTVLAVSNVNSNSLAEKDWVESLEDSPFWRRVWEEAEEEAQRMIERGVRSIFYSMPRERGMNRI